MAKTTDATGGQKQECGQCTFDLAELTKMYDFSGKTVAITGGSGVLGGEIACALVGCGGNVASLDVNTDPRKALLERVGERGKQISLFKGDGLDRENIFKTRW